MEKRTRCGRKRDGKGPFRHDPREAKMITCENASAAASGSDIATHHRDRVRREGAERLESARVRSTRADT
eukprot:1920387-Pleurochrysis_carterae.AAC.1